MLGNRKRRLILLHESIVGINQLEMTEIQVAKAIAGGWEIELNSGQKELLKDVYNGVKCSTERRWVIKFYTSNWNVYRANDEMTLIEWLGMVVEEDDEVGCEVKDRLWKNLEKCRNTKFKKVEKERILELREEYKAGLSDKVRKAIEKLFKKM